MVAAKLELREVSVTYPSGRQALREVSFSAEAGEFLLIMGPTGSGKSTLALRIMNVIPEVVRCSCSGEIILDGRDTAKETVHELAARVQLILQNPEAQLFSLTVEDDVFFGLENLALPAEEVSSRAGAALRQVGISHLRDRCTHELSGGEQQLAALACALAMQPDVLILDEPLTYLDPASREEFIEVLGRLKMRGKTILCIEHRADGLVELADRVLVLSEGRVVYHERPVVVFSRALEKELGVRVPLCAGAKGESPGRQQDPDWKGPARPGSSDELLIQMKGGGYVYEDGTRGLSGASLEVRAGEFVAVLGGNGTGKSTLAKCLTGLLDLMEGEIRYPWLRSSASDTYSVARSVGYVFQRPEVQLFCGSVREELEFGLRNYMVPKGEMARRVADVAARLHISELLSSHPQTLSRGQKRRVALASVLVLEPRVIILDEPTVGQDSLGLHGMMHLLDGLSRRGTAVMVITHDVALAAQYCSRAVVMAGGTVAADGPLPEVLRDDEVLARARLGKCPLPASQGVKEGAG